MTSRSAIQLAAITNIELEMELTKALAEIDKLKTILENHQDTASIKTIIFNKKSNNDSGVGSP